MRHIKLTIAYDGTNYSGWQIQPNVLTIQALVQDAVRNITREENDVVGASRTDAGVHAMAQVTTFRTDKDIPLDGFRCGINSLLPRDIRIMGAGEVVDSFHPIKDARLKHYCYLILEADFEHPIYLNRAWAIGRRLDIDAVNKAAGCLVGEHDFSAFRASDGNDKTQVRSIFSASISRIEKDSSCLPFGDAGGHFCSHRFDIVGNGFLKNMVRNIVGTLVDVGIGKITPEGFWAIKESMDRKKAGVCAPAHGLYLMSVNY